MENQKSRIQLLRERVEAAQGSKDRSTFDVPFRGKRLPFVKVRINTDFPLYRIQSGRTHRAQCAYLERHPDLGAGFFDDPEDPQVQAAQHELLVQMIKEKGLDADLKDRKQHSAIVLTYDGFIVDGNRRVAALRDAEEDYLTAVVLPKDATSREIFETEIELQMAQDTKAEYNWVDELVHIRYGAEVLKETYEQIAKRMRRSKQDVKDDLVRLQYVDSYLAWLGTPRQYHRIPDDGRGSMRQAFTDLAQRMNAKSVQKLTRPSKDAIREMCFAAIQNQEGYETIRTIISQVTKSAGAVVDRLSDLAKIDRSKPGTKVKADKKSANDDPLMQLASAEAKGTPKAFAALNEAFADPARAKQLAPSLVRVVTDLAEDEREARKQTQPLQLIEKAASWLDKVDLTASGGDIDRIAKALGKLQDRIEQLAKHISRLKAKKR